MKRLSYDIIPLLVIISCFLVIIFKNLILAWFPNNVETIQNLIKYNLAVALVYRGELERASEILKQLWLSKSSVSQIPIHVVMLVLYVELQLGMY